MACDDTVCLSKVSAPRSARAHDTTQGTHLGALRCRRGEWCALALVTRSRNRTSARPRHRARARPRTPPTVVRPSAAIPVPAPAPVVVRTVIVRGVRGRRANAELARDALDAVALAVVLVDVVLGLDAQAQVVEVLVRDRHLLALFAYEDARELPPEQHVHKRFQFRVFGRERG